MDKATPIEDGALDALVQLAGELADAAGAAALPHFRARALVAENKVAGKAEGSAGPGRHFDPVTAADRGAERAIRAILARQRPEDGVFGEEEAHLPGTSGLTWVIDPIDGTRSFVSGVPVWGVLVALDDGARGRIGVVDQPYTRERFAGVLREGGGGEAWMTGPTTGPAGRTALKTRPCAGLAEASLFTTDPFFFTEPERAAFDTVRRRVRMVRYGTDCYAYALLAAGLVDLVVEAGLEPYDIAALIPVITAAGGIVTDWQGGDCRWGGRVVAACSAELHAEALEILGRV